MTLKSTFHYIAHPHQGYRDGFTADIGTSNIHSEPYVVRTYCLPFEAVHKARICVRFYQSLIANTKCPEFKRRRKTPLDTWDIAVSLMERVENCLNQKRYFLMGTKFGPSPLAYAYVGPAADLKMARDTFESIWNVIGRYTEAYNETCHCLPYHVYQKHHYCETLTRWETSIEKTWNKNRILTGCILFLYETLKHCGPDTDVLYDFFTNDFSISAKDVDLNVWAKARSEAFQPSAEDSKNSFFPWISAYRIDTREGQRPQRVHRAYDPPTPAPPSHYAVEIIEKGGTLAEHADILMPFDFLYQFNAENGIKKDEQDRLVASALQQWRESGGSRLWGDWE